MDNSFNIPWLSSLYFQVTINNKARFMIFLINILNDQVTIIASKSKLPIFFFFRKFPWGFETLNQKNIIGIEFFSRKKKFKDKKSDAFFLTSKDKNSILM